MAEFFLPERKARSQSRKNWLRAFLYEQRKNVYNIRQTADVRKLSKNDLPRQFLKKSKNRYKGLPEGRDERRTIRNESRKRPENRKMADPISLYLSLIHI